MFTYLLTTLEARSNKFKCHTISKILIFVSESIACHMDATTSAPAKSAISWKKPGVKYAGNFPMVM